MEDIQAITKAVIVTEKFGPLDTGDEEVQD